MMALLPLSLWIVRVLTMPNMKRPVTSAPRFYPVVVVGRTDGGVLEPQVIYLFELPQIQKKYASWSFLVPENEIKRMQKQVEIAREGKTISGEELWSPSFKVKTNSDGTQEFEVSGALDDDDTNVSWYHAEGQNITAQYLESYGRHDAPADSCAAGAFMMVFWFVSCVVVIPYVAMRNRRASTPG
jgi:hypothetical protein